MLYRVEGDGGAEEGSWSNGFHSPRAFCRGPEIGRRLHDLQTLSFRSTYRPQQACSSRIMHQFSTCPTMMLAFIDCNGLRQVVRGSETLAPPSAPPTCRVACTELDFMPGLHYFQKASGGVKAPAGDVENEALNWK